MNLKITGQILLVALPSAFFMTGRFVYNGRLFITKWVILLRTHIPSLSHNSSLHILTQMVYPSENYKCNLAPCSNGGEPKKKGAEDEDKKDKIPRWLSTGFSTTRDAEFKDTWRWASGIQWQCYQMVAEWNTGQVIQAYSYAQIQNISSNT